MSIEGKLILNDRVNKLVKEKVEFMTSCRTYVRLNLVEVSGTRAFIEHDC
jgi:hypothetical protein